MARKGLLSRASAWAVATSFFGFTAFEGYAQPREDEPPLAEAAQAEDSAVVVRATAIPTGPVVRYVAANAEPHRFDAESQPELAPQTVRALIVQLCGSEQEGYFQQMQVMNGANAPGSLDEIAGERAYTWDWPACVFARDNSLERVEFVSRGGESAAAMARVLTGDEGANAANLFQQVFLSDRLPAGVRLRPIFITTPTLITPRPEAAKTFEAEIQQRFGASVNSRPADAAGYIYPVSIASADALDCDSESSSNYPFNPHAVVSAFEHSRARARLNGPVNRIVQLVVVDNGFFGVPCTEAACPVQTPSGLAYEPGRFPRYYFDQEQFAHDALGPNVVGVGLPLNYRPDLNLSVNSITGHGTHVAGLALGGARFAPQRAAVLGNDPGSAWLRLVPASLGAGEQYFRAGADEAAFAAIRRVGGSPDAPRIVNLSLGVDAAQDPEVSQRMRDEMLVGMNQTLFVAAAGNLGRKLEEIELYPARLGGEDGEANRFVITVASIDADHTISDFSNRGAFVDIAAPGCEMLSWLNAELPPERVSGTSQAAPIVSWTAAMLRSYSSLGPPALKMRLIVSGDLLQSAEERRLIHYGVELNISKALIMYDDIVTVRVGDSERTFVGTMGPYQGLRCADNENLSTTHILSFKRARDGSEARIYYAANPTGVLRHCPARWASTQYVLLSNDFAFEPTHELVDGGLRRAPADAPTNIRVADVLDVVWRTPR